MDGRGPEPDFSRLRRAFRRARRNDNQTLQHFVTAVRSVAPEAAGKPVFVIEAAATIVKAFLQAGVWSLASITLILFFALRRWTDVASVW